MQSEILRLEFSKKEPDTAGRISERQLAELLLTYADYTPKRRTATLKRVRKAFKVRKTFMVRKTFKVRKVFKVRKAFKVKKILQPQASPSPWCLLLVTA